jgi:membrane-bound metal-dependent hydrolase YbcI (DUF457 family)
MTPFGHASAAFISGSLFTRNSLRNAALFSLIIGATLPDIDYLFIMFDWFNRIHRVITHNLLFLVSASLIGSALAGKGDKKIVAIGLFAGGLLHLAIDSCLDNNPTNGIGIAFFWPFVKSFYSPFNLLKVNDAGIGWDQPLKMIRLEVPLLLYEVPLYFLAAFLLFRRMRRRRKSYVDRPSCADGA